MYLPNGYLAGVTQGGKMNRCRVIQDNFREESGMLSFLADCCCCYRSTSHNLENLLIRLFTYAKFPHQTVFDPHSPNSNHGLVQSSKRLWLEIPRITRLHASNLLCRHLLGIFALIISSDNHAYRPLTRSRTSIRTASLHQCYHMSFQNVQRSLLKMASQV
jgi:hypothetical protein